MEKKGYQYRLTVEALKNPQGAPVTHPPMELIFENHDDLYKVAEAVRASNIFSSPEEHTEFAIGLKLFSEVVLRHRNDPLFEELFPAIGAFMKKLKENR